MKNERSREAKERWLGDPAAFVRDVLINPETSAPFELYPEQVTFLRSALTLTPAGRLPFPELVYSAPKKSGKTAIAGMVAIYAAVVIGGPYAEVYCLANDFEQSTGRVFQAAARIVESSPLLRHTAKVVANKITFISTGSFIQACASDYSGFAGANPTLTICDELWGFVHEASRRLFDESVPSPARKVSGRLTVTYAGFEGESTLLEDLYKRGLKGEVIAPDLYRTAGSMLMYWTHRAPAPWQTAEWLQQMRDQLRPNQFLRMIENRFVTTESTFVDMDWWDACVDHDLRPALVDRSLPVWVGVDASVRRDSTAIVVTTFDAATRRVRLVWHRVFQPTPADPLDFEQTIEKTLFELRGRFRLKEIRYDPYQLVSVAQRLASKGLPMVEFSQTVSNLTEASSNLYELIKNRNLALYPDADMRLAVSRAVAIETPRGWRIAKEKVSHKIDSIVALAQAALGAVQGAQHKVSPYIAIMRDAQAGDERALQFFTGIPPTTRTPEQALLRAQSHGKHLDVDPGFFRTRTHHVATASDPLQWLFDAHRDRRLGGVDVLAEHYRGQLRPRLLRSTNPAAGEIIAELDRRF